MMITGNFKEYLERYCERYGLSREEALQHKIVKEVEMQYRALNRSYNERK